MNTHDSHNPGQERRSPDGLAKEITRLARGGDFSGAEKLRSTLLASHPMALSAIISTGEVIEEEKNLRIDKDHLAIWEKLYRTLTPEEQNCLFYATKKATVASGKVMLRQGKIVPRLLFIDSGRVTLFHSRGDDRILLGQLSRGDVLGEETFFSHSNPTFSAGAQTEVQLRYLDKSATGSWEEQQPGLYQKLADYCQQNCRAGLLMNQKNIEKRRFKRKRSESKVTAFVLGTDGGRGDENFRGSLMDLSRNGACFEIHCPRAETAQALLGRLVDIELEPEADGQNGRMVLQGTIVKVGILLHNDFTIHVRLHTELSPQEMELHVQPEGE